MNRKDRREYHKKWRDNTDQKKWLTGQRRRHRKWYYANLESARERARIAARKARAKDPAKYRAYIRKCWRANKTRNQHFVNAYKRTIGCRDCGETDPVVLDFDHVRGKKRCRVSSMVAQGWSLLTIFTEMEKCQLRCANCHRRRHNT